MLTRYFSRWESLGEVQFDGLLKSRRREHYCWSGISFAIDRSVRLDLMKHLNQTVSCISVKYYLNKNTHSTFFFQITFAKQVGGGMYTGRVSRLICNKFVRMIGINIMKNVNQVKCSRSRTKYMRIWKIKTSLKCAL